MIPTAAHPSTPDCRPLVVAGKMLPFLVGQLGFNRAFRLVFPVLELDDESFGREFISALKSSAIGREGGQNRV